MDKKIHIVFGPTASGKTEYSVELAQKFDSVIINGDSQQVYREIPIITNQPVTIERKNVPHFLFGYKSILEHSDLGIWLEDSVPLIKKILSENKTPIVIGGTGMYLKALINGVSEIPEISAEIRSKTRNMLLEIGNEKFYELLCKKDPHSAKLKPGDSQRMTRAYEVIDFTGMPIAEWNKKPNKKYFDREIFEIHFLDRPRTEIYDKINRRFEKFVELGAIFEAKKAKEIFEQSGFTRNELSALPAYKAHGIRELFDFIDGKIPLDEAIKQGQQVTRNYAKRQITWWKNQMFN